MGDQLKGKVAVVTGASRGVGQAIAEALAARGTRVALVARSRDQLHAVEENIRSAGGEARAIAADASQGEAVLSMQREVETQLGQAAILVNAAGIFGPISLIKDSDPARWIETLAINTIAPYLTCRAFAGGMIESGWGRIINVTSAAALHPPGPLNSAYATSKVALNQFTRHLAAELVGTGVTANVFHPGDVKTDMWATIRDEAEQMGAAGEAYRKWVAWVEETGGDPPYKAADLVLRLTEDAAASVNGQFLWIEDPLQAPISSWEDTANAQPWNQ
ncbi:MAG TPA: SDR family oxidoreductase [Abditibacteriaceae bacterium]|nr:SDR family oxidoreductase [Abditibacteriaceae bacterium]